MVVVVVVIIRFVRTMHEICKLRTKLKQKLCTNRFILHDFKQKRKPINLPLYEIWAYGHFNYCKIGREALRFARTLCQKKQNKNTFKIVKLWLMFDFHIYCCNFGITELFFPIHVEHSKWPNKIKLLTNFPMCMHNFLNQILCVLCVCVLQVTREFSIACRWLQSQWLLALVYNVRYFAPIVIIYRWFLMFIVIMTIWKCSMISKKITKFLQQFPLFVVLPGLISIVVNGP